MRGSVTNPVGQTLSRSAPLLYPVRGSVRGCGTRGGTTDQDGRTGAERAVQPVSVALSAAGAKGLRRSGSFLVKRGDGHQGVLPKTLASPQNRLTRAPSLFTVGPSQSLDDALGKRVGGNPSRVRISYPPPEGA